ncbi:MAG: sensory box protein [Dehalococcoidia bacterium]|nr:sensory box protein [Dehalococcoidia bacterium]
MSWLAKTDSRLDKILKRFGVLTSKTGEWVWIAARLAVAITIMVGARFYLYGSEAYIPLLWLAGFAIFYDLILLFLLRKKLLSLTLSIGYIFDKIVVSWGWLVVVKADSGAYTSNDLYLIIFPAMIVSGIRLGWFFGSINAALWLGWMTITFLVFLPAESYSVQQLPLRLLLMIITVTGVLRLVSQHSSSLKRTELLLQEVNSIISSMVEGLIAVDNKRNLVYCNTAAEKILGLEAVRFVGKHIKIFNTAISTRTVDPNEWNNIIDTALSQLDKQPKLIMQLKSPERRDIEVRFFRVGSPDERSGIGAILRDITREREIDKIKTDFISIASHELRTPMTVIYGFVELLLTTKVSAENQRVWLTRVHKESQRMNDIVEDLLNISRIESGRLSFKFEPVSVRALIKQITDEFKPICKIHTFYLHIPADFPELWADARLTTQVLYNLIDNAIKYSPKGGAISISASIAKETNQGIVSVTDKGIGIPPDEIPRLFTRFHRIPRDETLAIRGTGLGLAIVKQLVEMMNGKVWVESQLNQGSTFSIALPLAPSDGQAVSHEK